LHGVFGARRHDLTEYGRQSLLGQSELQHVNKFVRIDRNVCTHRYNAETLLRLLKEGSDQAEANKRDEALKSLEEAKRAYPGFKGYKGFESGIDLTIAFNTKDYDKFLSLEEAEAVRVPENSMAVAGVASALACKYAVTGDEKYARDTEDRLQKAQKLAGSDPQLMASYREYSERIRYRLKTREIIDKTEYDKRFRPELAKKETK